MKLVLFLSLLVTRFTACLPFTPRNTLNNGTAETYDYVVVGCGIAGLVVAARLSEDPTVSVVCIEAGSLDNYEDSIEIPVYIGERPAEYEWDVSTTPQRQLDGKPRVLAMGKGVGGGSLINGMLWNRGDQNDFNIWAVLGNPGWDWANLLPYFKKSEHYTPRYYQGLESQPVTFVEGMHGFFGPVNVSYPEYFWPQTNNWFEALEALHIPTCADPNDGLPCSGSYFLPSSLDSVNQTRSDARRAYHDMASGRANYYLITHARVERVLFDSEGDGNSNSTRTGPGGAAVRAVGVQVLNLLDNTTCTVQATREVVLAAGGIHTPQVLELSGIGNASLLASLGISVVQDLPGVGSNLQDHPMIHLDYPFQNTSVPTPGWLLTNSSFNSAAELEYFSSRTGPWTSKPSTAVAFPSLAEMTNSTHCISLIRDAMECFGLQPNLSTLPPEYYYSDPLCADQSGGNLTVLEVGYGMQHNLVAASLLLNTTPAYEILNDNSGGLDLALMHPLSRGTVHITSPDIRVDPSVNPNWLSHAVDFEILVLAVRFNQRILSTWSMDCLEPAFAPDPQGSIERNVTREQIESMLRQGIGTEFHYAGTAAMLPREVGGVVDTNLTVYGTQNLRVVDTSVFPVIPGAHLQAVAYAVAERASDIIKGVAVDVNAGVGGPV
ncbi:uncharacterized protein Z520_11345 [Fonsecaea multimorphosa CBS 102226]|uniref:Glucose-methanol-choline oxidoreductase N-terminal domain-containing protein n=1 Tax=Fonsecaea multimorphosa CBS 102226 TaxID=1442371 RepID=A0A0D2JQX5_9EURO|nr:uncharacterized protein Z520_11345 [Fonsecaea multimorphosa CBS 102226]KIX92869.1 hypothetical protein Z520_11345 [Fonsecaea multimorphosa CBS 102226]OAL18120.1 hypothetical protein AYO22_10897 [Fonsecaea multimorphosa]